MRGMRWLLAAVLLRAGGAGAVSHGPSNAFELTAYHINPLSKAIDGGSPIDMNTADAAGDFYFDMLEEYMYPLKCPEGEHSHSTACTNLEVAASDLVVTKLTLAVRAPFGSYARCNLCVNGTDHYNHTCPDGTYYCSPHANNYTVGYENLIREQAPSRLAKCTNKSSDFECWLMKLPWILTPDYPGSWYSTQHQGMCPNPSPGPAPAPAPGGATTACSAAPQHSVISWNSNTSTVVRMNASSADECCALCGDPDRGLANCTDYSYRPVYYPARKEPPCHLYAIPADELVEVLPGDEDDYSSGSLCAWRTLSVDKVVNATCQKDYFLSGIEIAGTPTDQECFTACGGVPGVKRNTSNSCWARCFYAAIMGPNASVAGGNVTGIPIGQIVDIWETPMRRDFTGCPDVRHTPRHT